MAELEIIKLAWVGTRTDDPEPTVWFFRDVMGLRLEAEHEGSWMVQLSDGGNSVRTVTHRHFTTGPVVGFLVDDVVSAAELLKAGSQLYPQTDDSATLGSTSEHRTETLRVHSGPWPSRRADGGASTQSTAPSLFTSQATSRSSATTALPYRHRPGGERTRFPVRYTSTTESPVGVPRPAWNIEIRIWAVLERRRRSDLLWL